MSKKYTVPLNWLYPMNPVTSVPNRDVDADSDSSDDDYELSSFLPRDPTTTVVATS